jgi:hypothetical protein
MKLPVALFIFTPPFPPAHFLTDFPPRLICGAACEIVFILPGGGRKINKNFWNENTGKYRLCLDMRRLCDAYGNTGAFILYCHREVSKQ